MSIQCDPLQKPQLFLIIQIFLSMAQINLNFIVVITTDAEFFQY